MVPTQLHRFQLRRPGEEDVLHLRNVLLEKGPESKKRIKVNTERGLAYTPRKN
ncbi:MAG: hypothetical protein ABEJ65_02285 [bacterium]